MADRTSPQMIVNARMLAFGWVPDEPERVLPLIPEGLRSLPDRRVFAMQYVVDSAVQTSGLGAHSATIVGVELDRTGPDGVTPIRLWTNAVASTGASRAFFAERGLEVDPGITTVTLRNDTVVASALLEGSTEPVLRTTCAIGLPTRFEGGRHAHVLRIDGRPVEDVHPWIATLADRWELRSVEFLDPSHAIAPLQPGRTPAATWGLYSPNVSFCMPGVGPAVPAEPEPPVRQTTTLGGGWRGSPY